MSRLIFDEVAWEDYLWCQSRDKRTLDKINALLKDVMRQPTEGMGHPEQLRGRVNTWSRRINEKDRLVYEVSDGEIVIKQCYGHYGDK